MVLRVGFASLRHDLDKSQQKSDWGKRPLTVAQIRYAALDALVPAMILRRLLAAHPSAAVLTCGGLSSGGGGMLPSAGGGGKRDGGRGRDRLRLNIAAAAQPWTRVERFAGSLGTVTGIGDAGEGKYSYADGPLPPPRTVEDVRAALEEAGDGNVFGPGGLPYLEEWDVRGGLGGESKCSYTVDSSEINGEGEPETETVAVPSGVTLCKTLGVVASGSRSHDVSLVVCVLELRERLRLDMNAVAGWLTKEEGGGGGDASAIMKCRLATPDELVAHFGFPRGCMGPVGLRHPHHRYRVLMDKALFQDARRGDPTPAGGERASRTSGGVESEQSYKVGGGGGSGGGGGGSIRGGSHGYGSTGGARLDGDVTAASDLARLACRSVGPSVGGDMDKSWRLIAVGGGAPRIKVVGRVGAIAALAHATVAPISHVVAA